jgi:hypothetical protein
MLRNPFNADHTAKTCTKCGLMRPLTDYHKSKTGRNGLRAICKVCVLAHCRAYVARCGRPERPIETVRAEHKAWREANIEHYREYQRIYHREWARANRAKQAAYSRNWYAKNIKKKETQ